MEGVPSRSPSGGGAVEHGVSLPKPPPPPRTFASPPLNFTPRNDSPTLRYRREHAPPLPHMAIAGVFCAPPPPHTTSDGVPDGQPAVRPRPTPVQRAA